EVGPWYYEMDEPGFNYRVTDLQCALGRSQLKKLPGFVRRRQEIVDRYNRAFADHGLIQTPYRNPETQPAWHLYVTQIDFDGLGKSRTEVMNQLRERNIGTQVHYIPVHLQPWYRRKYGYGPGKCPVAEAYYDRCLSLPLYPRMSDDDVSRVIEAVLEVVPS
ncbi:MAG: DegT/DnrJ/EryC1/StrS family aminotransferase, partial [Verrucomicrobiota bacterium]